MALDLWVRTNAGPATGSQPETTNSTDNEGNDVETVVYPEQAYLTLEGNLLTRDVDRQATVKANSQDCPVYVASFTVSGTQYKIDVYSLNDTYYLVDDYQVDADNTFQARTDVNEILPIVGISGNAVTYTPKMETVQEVIGYDGVNRIWTDEQMSPYEVPGGTSTTKGNGSCYVFYASNEADQTRFLKLLTAMKVVFVNEDGDMIGRADMDTEHFFAENGKVTVPLVLDKSSATSLGSDINGRAIYGLMPLEKNTPTRVTAIIYLDGTSLTNDTVLASGDIQGNLNLQFGSATACTVTTTTTYEEDGELIVHTDTGYTQPGTLEPITNPDLMEDYVSVSASASPTEFEYNESRPATTNITVNVDGTVPTSVAVRFTRAINSTQGVLQQMVNLERTRGTSWTGSYSFSKPGNYVMRSVFVDGVEYDLPTAVSASVIGSSVNSLTCDAITSGNEATILTADSRFNTKIIMGFSTSHAQPKTVRGIFLDDNGRQVTTVFSSAGSGNWSGTASFTSSGSFTMKYVEIDGEQYELAANLQPTLNLMLGLKVRTWISASEETLAKLQAIEASATPTRFTLDTAAKDDQGNVLLNITGNPGDDVTILVSAALYDNSDNLVTGFPSATVVYGKSGSATKKLDANLTWNGSRGRYEGEFLVTEAGTYKFTRMTVGENVITAFSTAPGIQALPPEDAYYFNNYTPEYQFAPNGDANATIGLAYSNAATKVTGVFRNSQGTTLESEAVLGGEAEDQGDKSVNLWYVPIPVVNGTQDGTWTLETVKMYGVYYEGTYYDEDTPAEIDLTGEHITTKVVNTIHTTFRGTGADYSGNFMDSHNTDFTIAISDFEGEPLENVTVSGVKVKYYLNTADTDSRYGYTAASGLDNYAAEGNATKQSDGTYKATVNFQVAGSYSNADIECVIDGKTYNESNMDFKYYDGGIVKDKEPQYTVAWAKPTIKITGSNPAKGTNFDINLASGSSLNAVTVQNYYEDYYANVYAKVSTLLGYATGYTLPTLTFTISNAGSNLSSTNHIVFLVPNPAYTSYAPKECNYTSNNSSKTVEIGDMDGNTRQLAGTIRISTVKAYVGSMEFTMPLTHEILVKETNAAPIKVTYVIPTEYQSQVSTPAADTSNRGTVVLPNPSKTSWTVTEEVAGEMSPETSTSSTSNVYTKVTSGSGCNAKTTYTNYTRTTKTYTSSGTAETRRDSFRVVGWKVGNKTYQPGDTLTYTSNTTVTLLVEKTSSELLSSRTSTRTRKTYTDVQTGTSTSSGTGTEVSTVYTSETTISDVYS